MSCQPFSLAAGDSPNEPVPFSGSEEAGPWQVEPPNGWPLTYDEYQAPLSSPSSCGSQHSCSQLRFSVDGVNVNEVSLAPGSATA